MENNRPYYVGVVGTGFIATGLMLAISKNPTFNISKILTRRRLKEVGNLPVKSSQLTNNINDLVKQSDVIVECSGDCVHGTQVAEAALKAKIPVVTMDSELQLVSGTKLSRLGTFVEAEGDQPGSLAALHKEVVAMGFKPMVYGNLKRYRNLDPSKQDMVYWGSKQGISLPQVTAFTDGSKVQIEQALVANGLGASIVQEDLLGPACQTLEEGVEILSHSAVSLGKPISDYIVSPQVPAGVFIVASHEKEQATYLDYLKLGKGPFYTLVKPFHLCHLEILKTLKKVIKGETDYDFNNGTNPKYQVVALSKRSLPAGYYVERALGSFDFRGSTVVIENNKSAVPISLLSTATLVRDVGPGEVITFDDVKLQSSLALDYWLETVYQSSQTSDLIIEQKVRLSKSTKNIARHLLKSPVFDSVGRIWRL